MAISFNQVGSFKGSNGGPTVLSNPTSIQFGADGRLYVSEQNGSINAFTIALQDGSYVATSHEELLLPGGGGVVKSITNHNDDGVKQSSVSNRQVTGIATAGTASNPVLYISSSDPRIATNSDSNLDTNSGVLTRITWTGTEWEAVDILRGLPRSEENHSNNGMVLSPDGTKLYLTVGGNTNNGAPSQFFAYTGEYALSGTVLEIDLVDIDSRPILTDPQGGQVGGVDAARKYVYDLPTLDDPSVPNDGVREDSNGLDVAGPWGGNDGFNMAILPADAPLRIYADGFRNHYDLVLSESGKLYTVDNGSNGNLGGDPILGSDGQATNQPNNGGDGDAEPLFLIEEGNYYGHPAPARANQDLPWVVYDNGGDPDGSVSPNSVPDLSALVPDGVNIAPGFIIDPSKFTGDPARLLESGVRIDRDSSESGAIVTIGSSSNGLVEYTGNAFDGALQGALLVAQFNGNVTALNLNDSGTALEPLIDPGNDGLLGTPDDVVIDSDGVYPLIGGLSVPLDVTTGPNGTVWVAEVGGDFIKVYAPSDTVLPDDPDFDNDGIDNVVDPFIRDASNGGSVVLFPGQTLLWDFDANQDENLPGPDGYGGGLTGVMIDGTTDFEVFFQSESDIPGQDVKLDNIKFITAAGGGTTVVENVSNGDPFTGSNSGEYLFHTGVTIAPIVDTFTVKWTVFNPANELTGASQQIGGYIGTGDQSNYLKLVATQDPGGEIQLVLEDNDIVVTSVFIQADDLFEVPLDQQILFELVVDPAAATATPTITYETGGTSKTVSGAAIDLSGTNVLDAILGNYSVQSQTTGLAVGLFSSNVGQSPSDTFQAIFADIEITATGDTSSQVLYRVNAGGPQVAAIDGGIAWSADTVGGNSPFLANAGSNNTAGFSVVPGATVAPTTPDSIFQSERWDNSAAPEMAWAFDVPVPGLYEVRLFLGNGYDGTSSPGERIFDVAVEGNVLSNLDDLDLTALFGHQVGAMISNTVNVTDGTLDIEFLHGTENPLINGIEIIQIGAVEDNPTVSIVGGPYSVNEGDAQVQISLLTDITVPSDETVNVTFEIVPGSATPQVDYEYLPDSFNPETGIYTDTVAIAGGSSDVTFLVDILQDSFVEGNEAFTVNITNVSSNADIGTASTTVTITDDEVPLSADLELSKTVDNATPSIGETIVFSLTVSNVGTEDATGVSLQDLLPDGFEYVSDTGNSAYSAETGIWDVGPVVSGGSATLDITVNVVEPAQVGESTVLYRVNAGGSEISATDGGPNWTADLKGAQSPFLSNAGSNSVFTTGSAVTLDGSVPVGTPVALFQQERWDSAGADAMQWAFPIVEPGTEVEVRLYFAEIYGGITGAGQRVFDVQVEGSIPAAFDNIDPFAISGSSLNAGFMLSDTFTIDDGTLNLSFVHGIENPALKGIEILTLGGGGSSPSSYTNYAQILTLDQIDSDSTPGDDSVGDDDDATVVVTPDGSTNNNIAVSIAVGQNAAEPALSGQFVVSLSESATTNTVIAYTVSGTATSGADYTALQNTVTIPAGALSALIAVEVQDDFDVEGDETVTLTLNSVTAGDDGIEIAAENTATLAISDNDSNNNTVSIAVGQNAAEPALSGQFVVSLSESAATDTVIAYTVSGTATSGADYTALQNTVTIPAGELSALIAVEVQDDFDVEGDETVTLTLNSVTAGDDGIEIAAENTATVTISDNDAPPVGGGEAVLSINLNSNNIQISNFGNNSFQIANTGSKEIAQVDIDVTNALYPDSVFDPFGQAGDTASKPLTINSNGGTGVVAPSNASYIGAGGTSGYEGLLLVFDSNVNGGFEPGESIGFSVDMDPNSVAGTEKGPLDSGSSPAWDVGGVSGAELIGSSFTVTFTDGTTATGQLQGNNNQGGSQGLASQDSPNVPVTLTVNGLNAGEIGTYSASGPSVIVNGPSGQTARVVLTKGFIQPVTPYAPFLQTQLAALAASDFPANNAVEFQTVDILLTGENQDISDLFNFSDVANYSFAGEDTLPLGFVASVIDPSNSNLPIGSVTQPIYLQFVGQSEVSITTTQQASEPNASGQFTVSLSEISSTDTVIAYTVSGTATSGSDYTALQNTVTIPAGELSALIDVEVQDDFDVEGSESVTVTLNAITAGDADFVIGAADTATVVISDDDSTTGPTALYRVNAGGPEVTAIDGGINWSADTVTNNSPYLIEPGSNKTANFNVLPGATVASTTPGAIFQTERWDALTDPGMAWAFDTPEAGSYEVRLFLGNGFSGTSNPGERVFDVAIEGTVLSNLDNIDLASQFGHLTGGMISNTVTVNDGTLNIDFLHITENTENPLINGIEIIRS